MNQAEYLVAATPIDGTSCDHEAIHIPGLIQPFGYLVAVNAIGRITRISENLCEIIGMRGADLLNQDIAVIDPQLRDVAKNPGDVDKKVRLRGRSLVGRCFKANDEWVVELQPQDEAATPSMLKTFHQSILDIGRQQSLDEVVSCLPGLVKELTGYDRVMVYQFEEDAHGAVVAEAKNEDLEPLLGLHYPATDIPVQARALYKQNLIRMISDVNYAPVAVVSAANLGPLDLTMSHLRSISPMHVQYLKNMLVSATLVVSLIADGELWGLIACHHYQGPRYLDPSCRQMCISVGAVASFAIGSWKELHRRVRMFTNGLIAEKFIADLKRNRSVAESLAIHHESLLLAAGARGLCLIEHETVTTWGVCPSLSDIHKLGRWIGSILTDQKLYQTNHLKRDYEDAEAIKDTASGMIAIRLPVNFSNTSKNCFLLWFQPEQIETIYWAGNPEKAVNTNAAGSVLSPRSSFEKWKGIRKNRSIPWPEEVLTTVARFNLHIVDSALEDFRMLSHRAQVRISQLERLSSLGQLSTGIAHDFNNILLGIQGGAQLISGTSDGKKIESAVGRIKMFCERGAILVQGLLRHSRADAADYTFADCRSILNDLTAFVHTMEGRQFNFEIRDHTAPGQLLIVGNGNEILQCLLNLINNAKDAQIGRSGVIEITMAEDNARELVLFSVKDQGTGIDPQHLERIFDLFFSTKKANAGTGLGLANVRQIVRSHGGDVSVQSKLDQGSTFTLSLPKQKIPKQHQLQTDSTVGKGVYHKPRDMRQASVLYVEDDGDLRETFTELLLEYFATVESVDGGEAALDLLRRDQRRFDLVISDLRMNGMDGMAFYLEFRQLHLTTPFVMATGELLTKQAVLGDRTDPNFDMISKPFEVEKLIEMVAGFAQGSGEAKH
ncbi:MAG: ATP-binding protein [Proteobacteria bacterium]|nr:ATP-binding protein [Pseudomonadota bacterium]